MRTVFIFFSIAVLFACIQYSYGAPRRIQSLDSDEVPKYAYKLKPYMNDDLTEELRESSENEKKKKINADTSDYIGNSDELSNEQNNKEDDDSEAMFSNFVNSDGEKDFENSDEV